MNRTDLVDILQRIKDIKVAVVGDFALDRYFIVDISLNEPSLETGLIAYQVVKTTKSLGASGSVACNLAVMGATALAVGYKGSDSAGFDMAEEMHNLAIEDEYLLQSDRIVTPQYIKVIHLDNGSRTESNRFDIKNFNPTPADMEQKLLDRLPEVFQKCDAVIILDQMTEQNCGVITDRVREKLISLAAYHDDKIVIVDSRTRIGLYAHMSIKCNQMEACRAFYKDITEEPDMETIIDCGNKLFEKNKKPVFITLGKDGLLSFSKAGVIHIPTADVPSPIDIVGAGDSVTAAVASALAVGASPADAGLLGNIVASVTIRQIGRTGAASPEQIVEAYEQFFAK